MSKSIFISVASYCDDLLLYTINRALTTAKNPHMLHFGVVDQNINNISIINPSEVLPARISYAHIDAIYARGPCWARSLVMSLYNDEDYFFQIDAHTDFCLGWDEYLISQAEGLSMCNRNYCLTAYPQSFYIKNGEVIHGHLMEDGDFLEKELAADWFAVVGVGAIHMYNALAKVAKKFNVIDDEVVVKRLETIRQYL